MKVLEIFESIDGEVNYWGQGTISTFIRFAGCNLRCSYCDTKDSQGIDKGISISVKDLAEGVRTHKVTLTGGEPMCQDLEDLRDLIFRLKCNQKKITIETNGTYSLRPLYTDHDTNCSFVIDYKIDEDFKAELDILRMYDWIKIPIRDELDYGTAREVASVFSKKCYARLAFSPVGVSPKELLKNMIADKLDYVALNVQLHKLLQIS